MSSFNFEWLKEPKGIIRVVIFIICVFAITTINSNNTTGAITIQCPNSTDVKLTFDIHYPFTLGDKGKVVCSQTPFSIQKGSPNPAQFFSFMIVVGMIICAISMGMFTFFRENYDNSDRIRNIDFIQNCFQVFFLLIASIVWLQKISDINYQTSQGQIPLCKILTCSQYSQPSLLNAKVSAVFGFLTLVFWVFNLWITLKETTWFARWKVAHNPTMEINDML